MRSRTRALFRIAFVVAMAALPPFAFSQPARDSVAISTKAGYARLLFAFEEPAPVKASILDGVLTIELARAIDASVDSIVTELGPYVSVGKRSDDGLTYRFALQHPLGLHVSTAGNRTAVDLVPVSFKGEPPDLPRPAPPPRKQTVDVAKLPVVPVRVS